MLTGGSRPESAAAESVPVFSARVLTALASTPISSPPSPSLKHASVTSAATLELQSEGRTLRSLHMMNGDGDILVRLFPRRRGGWSSSMQLLPLIVVKFTRYLGVVLANFG